MKEKSRKIIKYYAIGFVILYALFITVSYQILTNKNKIDINAEIPDFALENQFKEFNSFKDFKGKMLLVDFWFAGCKPCQEEMKFFPHLLEQYAEELAVMSISFDPAEKTNELLQSKDGPWSFLIADNPNWTFYNDSMKDKSYIKSLNIREYPSYLLFNKEGKLISAPLSGVMQVEKELGGIFDFGFAYQVRKGKWLKSLFLIIPYAIFASIIQLVIIIIKKRRNS